MNPESLEDQKQSVKESMNATGSQIKEVVEGETSNPLAYEEVAPATPTPDYEPPQYQSNDAHQSTGHREDGSDLD